MFEISVHYAPQFRKISDRNIIDFRTPVIDYHLRVFRLAAIASSVAAL